MIRNGTALCAAMIVLTALNGCGLVRSQAISAARGPEQLISYTDKQLCNPYVTITPIVATERIRRELGDCSAAHRSCKASGFQLGTNQYLTCRQFVGAENAAAPKTSKGTTAVGREDDGVSWHQLTNTLTNINDYIINNIIK